MDPSAIPHVVAIAGDPGGANALAPVIRWLQEEQMVRVTALAYREARALWSGQGISFREIAGSTSLADARKLLMVQRADILIVATSFNPENLEQVFTLAAHGLGIPSVAVLDYWSNYTLRFGQTPFHFLLQPDRIAVMDDFAREEMVCEGFDPSRIKVTGQPAFDDLAAFKRGFSLEKILQIRNQLGISPGEFLILFASQPLSAIFGDKPDQPLFPGYSEKTVLSSLLRALDRITASGSPQVTLLVLPHPKELKEEYPWPQEAGRLRVLSGRGMNAREAVMAADIVIGMTTVLLVEACYLGKLVVSLQPGIRIPDPLPTNRLGWSIPVFREEDIEPTLHRLLTDPLERCKIEERLRNLEPDHLATGRVVSLVYGMLGLSGSREEEEWAD